MKFTLVKCATEMHINTSNATSHTPNETLRGQPKAISG